MLQIEKLFIRVHGFVRFMQGIQDIFPVLL